MNCIYCDNTAEDLDHVPPKSMFPPGSNNLITVPSCKSCNGKWGFDDEYVRNIFAMCENIDGDTKLESIIQKSVRSMLRPKAKKLHDAIIETVFIEPQYDGPDKIGYTADGNRIIKWATRIVIGIFFHKYKIKIQDTKIRVYMLNIALNLSNSGEIKNSLFGYMKNNDPVISGNGIFKYWIQTQNLNHGFVFVLYDKLIFGGLINDVNVDLIQ